MDVARVMIIWSYVAPDSEEVTQPAGFDPTNPNDPRYNWSADRPDDGPAEGLRASSRSSRSPARARSGRSQENRARTSATSPTRRSSPSSPSAAAKRYGADVNRWLIWNEPNVNSWLLAAAELHGRQVHARSPRRSTATSCAPPTRSSRPQDPGSTVLAGTLAPRGQTPTKTQRQRPPAGLPARLRLRRRQAAPRAQEQVLQGGFKAPVADGFAYHPHGTLFAPTKSLPNKDEASLADFGSACCRRSTASRRRAAS